ncbi:MAG TPA: hypothetical protein VF796_05200 [Humisphaera sp.]
MLEKLLGDPDPKVRALAAVLAMDLPDLALLPSVAAIADDRARAFDEPELIIGEAFIPGRRPVPPTMTPRTVGDVARAVVRFYAERSHELREHANRHGAPAGPLARAVRAAVARRRGSLSTMEVRVRMDRATGGMSPLRPDRVARVEAALADLQQLPAPRQLFAALAIGFEQYQPKWYTGPHLANLAGQVPRHVRLAVLGGASPADDPDLPPGFGRDYLLQHATTLFSSPDADLFLKLERDERARTVGPRRPQGWSTAAYAIAAARLRPAHAGRILTDALARFDDEFDGDHRWKLMAALVELTGQAGMPAAVDWFYGDQPERGSFPGRRVQFLAEVQFRRPDVFPELARHVVADPRLDRLGPQSTRALIVFAQARLGRSLATEVELWDAYRIDEAQRDRKLAALGRWQAALRETVKEWGPDAGAK